MENGRFALLSSL